MPKYDYIEISKSYAPRGIIKITYHGEGEYEIKGYGYFPLEGIAKDLLEKLYILRNNSSVDKKNEHTFKLTRTQTRVKKVRKKKIKKKMKWTGTHFRIF